jgi:hypothetical protein
MMISHTSINKKCHCCGCKGSNVKCYSISKDEASSFSDLVIDQKFAVGSTFCCNCYDVLSARAKHIGQPSGVGLLLYLYCVCNLGYYRHYQ